MFTTATVFGTRPEAIKLAPVIKALENAPDFRQTVIVTAQHRQMLDQVLALFEITPDHDLDLMTPNQSLAALTSRAIVALTDLFEQTRPDLVVVQGDTTTTFCAALAAYYKQIPVAHVEAGLRTHRRYSPWPEELNRQLTGRLADLHFPPTARSRQNLLSEGVPDEAIEVTGNTVIDAVFWVLARLDQQLAEGRVSAAELLRDNALGGEIEDRTLEAVGAIERGERRLVLITGHRRESFGGGFERICRALAELAAHYPECELVYPVHLNPNVRRPVHATLGDLPNVHLLPPLDYLPFVYLMRLSTLILTDSGGIQEEAPSLGKPVLVMRDTTERPEGVEAGTVALVGTSVERIVAEVARLLDDPAHYERMATAVNPYGDGKASDRIVARLRRFAEPRKDATDV